jgi:membrane-associated phospholipid phosphatase
MKLTKLLLSGNPDLASGKSRNALRTESFKATNLENADCGRAGQAGLCVPPHKWLQTQTQLKIIAENMALLHLLVNYSKRFSIGMESGLVSIGGIIRSGVYGRSTILATLVLCYTISIAVAFPKTYFTLLFDGYAPTAIFGFPIISALVIPIGSIIGRPQSPLSFLRDRIIANGIPTIIITLFFCLGMAAFTTFKFHIVSALGFYADPMLADFDVWLHGIDPWRLAHDQFPTNLAFILVVAYGGFWLVQFLGTLIYVSLFTEEPERTRYLTAFSFTIVLLGSLLAAISSSAGPIFYDRIFNSQRFSELANILSLNSETAEYLGISDHLYASYHNDTAVLGTGISAMPSVHVGIVVLNALFYSSRSFVLGLIAWLYAAVVMFGSVYSGFHYAIDGYVSLAVVLLLWLATSRYLATPSGSSSSM